MSFTKFINIHYVGVNINNRKGLDIDALVLNKYFTLIKQQFDSFRYYQSTIYFFNNFAKEKYQLTLNKLVKF